MLASHCKAQICAKFVKALLPAYMSISTQNYYEILNVRKDCSAKDIRNAYIKLSKQMHPDRNHSDPRTHQKFVKLNEAYSILSRQHERNIYDMSLENLQKTYRNAPANNNATYNRTYNDPSQYYGFWRRDKHGTDDIKGKKNLSKSWIVFLCITFTSVGVGLQILAIRKSVTFSRDRLDKMSEENGRILADLKRHAQENGFEKQLQIMKQKIEDSVEQYNQSRGIDK